MRLEVFVCEHCGKITRADLPPHGSLSRYEKHSCRCRQCRAAAADAKWRYRQRKRQEQATP